MVNNNYIILTATVTPAMAIGNTIRSDPQLRLQEYLSAFDFYWSLPDQLVAGIVLLENSGHSFENFENIVKSKACLKEVFFISTTQDYPAENGKGYGEFFMLDQGIQQLRLNGLTGGSLLWKVTGRLIVKNMREMLEEAPDTFSLYADFRHIPFFGKRLGGNEWLELRIAAMSLDGYDKYFRNHFSDGYVIEHAFFERLYPILKQRDTSVYPRFNTQPELLGVSGYSNKSYSSFEYKIKGLIRKISRKITPWFWI